LDIQSHHLIDPNIPISQFPIQEISSIKIYFHFYIYW